MSVVAFDTLKFAQTLRDKAHVPQDQAEGMAQAFADATSEQIATKTDLKSEIAAVRTDIELVKRDLKIWFGSVMVIAVGVILAAIRYLPAPHP